MKNYKFLLRADSYFVQKNFKSYVREINVANESFFIRSQIRNDKNVYFKLNLSEYNFIRT